MLINIEKVKEFIRNYDGSQAELSRQSGIHPSMLSKVLAGERRPANKTLEALVKAGLKQEDIFYWEG